MKTEMTRPKHYKGYIIVGVAIEAAALKSWKSTGIVYARNSRKELKRLDKLKQAACRDKRHAQYHQAELDQLLIGTHDRIADVKPVRTSGSSRNRVQ